MKEDNIQKTKLYEEDTNMSTLHSLKDAQKVWDYAKKNTKYNKEGQPTISKEERESEPDWE